MGNRTASGRNGLGIPVRLRYLVLAPIACGLMGATGENTVFNCGVSGAINQVTGPCSGDGGIDCNPDGGTGSGGNPGGGGTSPDAGTGGAPGSLTLNLAALPSTTVAPGQDLLLEATLTGGTPAEAAVVQTVAWFLSFPVGETPPMGCTDSPNECLGKIPESSSTNVSQLGRAFLVPYTAYTSGASTCSGETAIGVSVLLTAIALDSSSNTVGAASLAVHIGCSTLDVSPTSASAAPGGADVMFVASQNGIPIDALWSVVPLSSAGDNLGFVVAGLDGEGDYMPPTIFPADIPAAMIVATDPLDPSVTGGSVVWLSFTPISVAITTPSTLPTTVTATTAFVATVSGTTDWEPNTDVTWTLTPPMGVTLGSDVELTSITSTGATLTINQVTVQEAGTYTLTATSVQDASKLASATFSIPADRILSVSLAASEAVLPGDNVTLSETVAESHTSGYSFSTGTSYTVTWVLTPAMDGLSLLASPTTNTSTGASTDIFSAGAVQATTVYTATVTVTDNTNMLVGTATTTITVPGPVGVSLPTGVTIPAGLSQTVDAGLEDSDGGITWALSPTPPSTSFTGVSGGWVHIDPRSTATTYTLTATSTVDTTKSASTTVTVPADPNGLAGSVTYYGALTGPVYVSCLSGTGQPINEGTSFTPSWAIDAGMSIPTTFAYRIHGDLCAGFVLAYMDEIGTGVFVYGADPYAMQTVPTDGSNTLNLTLQDPPTATDPPDDVSVPTIHSVVTGFDGTTGSAVVYYSIASDSQGLEWPQQYIITYTVNTSDMGDYHTLVVSAGTSNTAFIDGLTGCANYFFAIQAAYTPYMGTPAGSCSSPTVCVPSSPSGGGGWTEAPVPQTGDGSITGAVDLTGLTQPAGLNSGSHSYLRVVANDNSGFVGVASSEFTPTMTSEMPILGYTVSGLPTPSMEMDNLTFYVDWFDNGYLTQTDYIATTINQVSLLEDILLQMPGGPFTASVMNLPLGETSSIAAGTYNVNQPQTLAYSMSYVQRDTYDSSILAFPTYLVTPGSTPIAQVTRMPWVWDDSAQDLISFNNIGQQGIPMRNAAFVVDGIGGSTAPVPGGVVPYFVQFIDGTLQTMTATLNDSMSNGLAVTFTPETDGSITSENPTMIWTTPTLHAPHNYIDHYDIEVGPLDTGMGYTWTATADGSSNSFYLTDGSLTWSTSYAFSLAAVDRYGDVEVMTGSFSIGAMP